MSQTYNNIGVCFSKLENFHDTLKWFEKALSVTIYNLGEEHPNTARIYSNIATTYQERGYVFEALGFNKKALKILKNNFDENHHRVLEVQNNILSLCNTWSRWH
jgi:tetratricopeptide (TPR) repeat protein